MVSLFRSSRDLSGAVLILAEHHRGEVDTIALEMIGKGRELSDRLQVPLVALVMGSEVARVRQALLGEGPDVILVADHPSLDPYNPETYCTVVTKLFREVRPRLLLVGYTCMGIEVGGSVAARLGVPLLANCVDIELAGGALTVVRPKFGSVVYVRQQVVGLSPTIISVQRASLPLGSATSAAGSVGTVSIPDNLQDGEHCRRIKARNLSEVSSGDIDIAKARIIVAAGRGVGKEDNLKLIESLADALGGTLACSRPLVDMGWLPPERQVGTSAKTVAPDLYIACGISGALQHVAGMRGAKTIVAINNDPNAPIFRFADYCIVADLFEVVPALIKEAQGFKRWSTQAVKHSSG